MDHQPKVTRRDGDTEAIKHQMDETRHALAEKLGMLEHQVADTVQGAVDTVENVKRSVESTVQTVKDSVRDTVETVQDTLDVRRQVDRHPWAMMAGAVALGYLGGYVCCQTMESRSSSGSSFSPLSAFSGRRKRHETGNGHGNGHGSRWKTEPDHQPEPAREQPSSTAAAMDWVSKHSEWLQPAINQLKGLAVGATVGIVRDMVTKSLPDEMKGQVSDVLNDITVSLGGKPIKGHILPERSPASNRPRRDSGSQAHTGYSSGEREFASQPQSGAQSGVGGAGRYTIPPETSDI